MNKTPLIENGCKELLGYGVWDRKTRVKRLVKKRILGRETAAEDLIFWPTGLLARGLWECREEARRACADGGTAGLDADEAGRRIILIDGALETYFDRWQRRGMPIGVLDDLLAGEVFLEQYLGRADAAAENGRKADSTEKGSGRESAAGGGGRDEADAEKGSGQDKAVRQYREALDKMADYALSCPRDEAGSFLYRAGQNNGYVFADGLGLACPFLYRYGVVFDRKECRELAVRQIVNFLAYGMDGATGLPYHGYAMAEGCKYGIIGWGRAVGWTLRGMAGCLQSDYGRERLEASFAALVDRVLSWQRADGYFSWQLQALEGPGDTSATGMICGALQEGIDRGILAGESYVKALRRGSCALEKSVRDGGVYGCSGECEGFGCYPQRYGAYPWSLGPALMVCENEAEE